MGFSALPQSDLSVWTISELNAYIRELFEIDYRLQDVSVEGEISNFTHARSGHLYFTLKDDGSQLKCVMWRSQAERLDFRPQNGDAVVASGRLSVYEAGGVYQLYASRLRPAGRGDLAQAFEQLKQLLESQGLFDAEHKQPLPALPRKIGIVTSINAAALRDILNVLRRRFPAVEVLIAPTLVQGTAAPAQIVDALRWLDGRDDIDVILVTRGGGSIEDLWAFNDEGVARAIFAAHHPIISGVGHETDFTIADYVADVRAPTPSAAAELAVPDMAELQGALVGIDHMLSQLMIRQVMENQQRVDGLARVLTAMGPDSGIENAGRQVETLDNRLRNGIERILERYDGRVKMWDARLAAVDPRATLARGYAIVRDSEGNLVASVGQVGIDQAVEIEVADGRLIATVSAIELESEDGSGAGKSE